MRDDTVEIDLSLIDQVVQVNESGQTAYVARFGVGPQATVVPHVDMLRIGGARPQDVLHVRIWNRAELVYHVAGYQDRIGRTVSAGELIQAMAAFERGPGMSIGLRLLGLRPADLRIEVGHARLSQGAAAAPKVVLVGPAAA